MDRSHLAPLTMLPWIALFAPSTAPAQPRDDPAGPAITPQQGDAIDSTAERAAHLQELNEWLRQLVGRFRYEGIADPGGENARGVGDCAAIGAGAGVQCMIHVSWPSVRDRPGLSLLEPAMLLYGIDPQRQQVRRLQVDSKSIAVEAFGNLSGNRVKFKFDCVNEPAFPPCRRFVVIEVAREGRLIYFWDDTEKLMGNDWVRVAGYMFSLRRVPEPAIR